MKFDKVQFVYIDIDYLEYLHEIEPEIYFDKDKQKDYRQRILSVLDLRKMFPVDDSVYKKVKFDISSGMSRSDNQRTFLMIKEYNFLTEIADEIEKKATKIYDKQIIKNKVLKYHCDYRKLEKAFDKYRENNY